MTTRSDNLPRRFARIYTAAITDVMDEMGLQRQTLPAAIQPLLPDMRAAGYAFTARGRERLGAAADDRRRAHRAGRRGRRRPRRRRGRSAPGRVRGAGPLREAGRHGEQGADGGQARHAAAGRLREVRKFLRTWGPRYGPQPPNPRAPRPSRGALRFCLGPPRDGPQPPNPRAPRPSRGALRFCLGRPEMAPKPPTLTAPRPMPWRRGVLAVSGGAVVGRGLEAGHVDSGRSERPADAIADPLRVPPF